MKDNCPICQKKPVSETANPFCSKRCADIDLGRWLKGGYAIAGQDGEAGDLSEANPDADVTFVDED